MFYMLHQMSSRSSKTEHTICGVCFVCSNCSEEQELCSTFFQLKFEHKQKWQQWERKWPMQNGQFCNCNINIARNITNLGYILLLLRQTILTLIPVEALMNVNLQKTFSFPDRIFVIILFLTNQHQFELNKYKLKFWNKYTNSIL